MSNIAIISCSNVKNELNCPGTGCFHSFANNIGAFKKYKNSNSNIVGFSTCAGCPTIYAAEKILNKVKPLIELSHADTPHFSTCMVKFCPFLKKYANLIKEKYPDIVLVYGTDESTSFENMKKMLRDLLINTDCDITEAIKKCK
ncbi:CGGC domain-containing protein [Pectinatus brassicae]|uniref:Putative metal-binding protein n=1 Tax=Pectinatus brassicae TaxID=862415 RepID=A0A840UKS0_9FIRM|nr:CGGC domain-containing protein [Pectinatus brassicae]MBB5337609.1 putative metal-binding protein [Pectinatus brassicae]